MPSPVWAVPLILIEATGFAALTPALYAIVAAGSPPGRSSTAQGLFGGAGTIGFVAASLIAGVLAEINIRLPFWFFSAVMLLCLATGLLVAGRALFTFGRAVPEVDVEAGAAGGV
jgi:MFS family permease